jgi:undecaprenyl-phosphate 4-deoxy-4-formamido-L-arabinose transferase
LKFSIIIPVFRGGNPIQLLYKRIDEILSDEFEFEVLFICDDCDSKSLATVKELKRIDPSRVKIFQLAQNYGQHRSLQFGFSMAIGDFIITMDEDLQHDPTDILKLVEKQQEGNFDIVYAKFNDLKHEGMRNKLSHILRKILIYFLPTLYENYSPFRLIKHKIAIRTTYMICPYIFIDDFLSRVTQNIAVTDIIHHKRMEGESSYTILKIIKHSIYILLAYSKIVIWVTAFAILSILTCILMVVGNIINSDKTGKEIFDMRIIIMTIGLGLFLTIASLLGKYINRRNAIRNTQPVSLINDETI